MLFWSVCNWDDDFQHTRTYLGLVCSFAPVWKCANKHLQDSLLHSLSWNVTDYFRTRNCSSAVAFDLPNRRWQVLLGWALASAALVSAVQARCSTALRNRLPSALPVHQGSLLCCPLLGCLAMRSHVLMIHQPWQLVQFWPWMELEMTAIRGTAIELWLFQKLYFPVAHPMGSSGHFS